MNFPHVNMDLIAGLPEDTPEGFRRTLDTCLQCGADNITVHTLSLKGQPHPPRAPTIPSAEAVGDAGLCNEALRAADFAPYYLYRQKYMSGSFENVGWCISGAEGLYNIYIMEELHSILCWARAARQRWWTPRAAASSGSSTRSTPTSTSRGRRRFRKTSRPSAASTSRCCKIRNQNLSAPSGQIFAKKSHSLTEFAARKPRIRLNPYFAAACTPRIFLCAERSVAAPSLAVGQGMERSEILLMGKWASPPFP